MSGPVDDLGSLPPALRVGDAAALLQVSRAALYAACARGEVPSIRVGRSVRIARRTILDMLGEAP